ncbi:class I SAM-dependent methyltransferase [Sphaerisporangium fuscum]|uniref:class I SAM-dependent methyltransferase n=1 Tax=Sphaerisporangium fuscum TaxID=2835868 RepID=UPI001BDD3B72|nr:class I SAM-dependent methyltransferase [Sphaerisporangium fuscum]
MSGNAEEVTRRNAEAEGVAGRVELVTGDMRSLPVEDASFDLVVSSLAVHNIPDADGRDGAITEAYRVTAPGGRLLLADFRHAPRYADVLRGLGAQEVAVRDLGWRFWYGGPWFGTGMVTARKPG